MKDSYKIIFGLLVSLAISPIDIAKADEAFDLDKEIVYYDDSNLDDVFEKYKVNKSEEKSEDDKTGYTIEDDHVYNNDGTLVKSSYVNSQGKTYLTDQDGRLRRGKVDYKDGTSSYFGKDGSLSKDERVVADGGFFKSDQAGNLSLIKEPVRGFVENEDDSYYFLENGILARGMTDTQKGRFFFDKSLGYMLKDTIVDDIYVHKDGRANYIGWDYYEGKLGYFDKKDGYTKGLKTIGNITYGFGEDGSILRKQIRVFDGVNYYFNKYGEATRTNGNFPRGWVGDRYFFSDGRPAEGLVDIGGKKYAFHERSLRLLRNTNKVFDHKMYHINDRGEAVYKYDIAHSNLARGTNGKFSPGFSQNLMRKTPYFNQRDPRWSEVSFAGGTMAGYGCGPTVMAMVLNRKLNTNNIYPTNTMAIASDYSSWDGTDWQYFIEGVEGYGLRSYDVPVKKEAFIQALKDNPIVIRVGSGYFINTGHYLVIDSYRDGYFLINDPYYGRKNTREMHSWDRLRAEVTVAWEIK